VARGMDAKQVQRMHKGFGVIQKNGEGFGMDPQAARVLVSTRVAWGGPCFECDLSCV
jgi:hypothetical protein